MNVLLFSRILAKTGVGNYVKTLAGELVAKGHNVIVVSSTKDLDLDERVKFIRLPVASNNPFRILKVVKRLRQIIDENSVQVVHCHHRKAALIMKLYNVFYKTPFVYTLHTSNLPSDFIHRKLTFVGERAIAISKEVAKTLVKELKTPSNKVVNIPNGVKPMIALTDEEKEEQRALWKLPSNKYIFAMHSRIDEIKNHLLVVEAIGRLSQTAKNRIVVVCSGEKNGEYYSKVVKKIEELGLNELFRFVGWCDTRSILGISDFLILPSIKEGFALSVVEAFMLKVPVARTKTAGFDEQKFCLPIDQYDPQPIIDIIEDLVKNGKEQYKERTELAYDLAMKEFTIEVMTARNVRVYEEVCGK